jgi:hypothetical protein
VYLDGHNFNVLSSDMPYKESYCRTRRAYRRVQVPQISLTRVTTDSVEVVSLLTTLKIERAFPKISHWFASSTWVPPSPSSVSHCTVSTVILQGKVNQSAIPRGGFRYRTIQVRRRQARWSRTSMHLGPVFWRLSCRQCRLTRRPLDRFHYIFQPKSKLACPMSCIKHIVDSKAPIMGGSTPTPSPDR